MMLHLFNTDPLWMEGIQREISAPSGRECKRNWILLAECVVEWR